MFISFFGSARKLPFAITAKSLPPHQAAPALAAPGASAGGDLRHASNPAPGVKADLINLHPPGAQRPCAQPGIRRSRAGNARHADKAPTRLAGQTAAARQAK